MHRRTRHGIVAVAASTALAVTLFGTANAQDPTTTTTEATTTTAASGPEEVNAKVTGEVDANGNVITLPDGSAFEGTIDYGTGAFDGAMSIPDITAETSATVAGIGEVPVTIVVRLTDSGTSGTIADDDTVAASSSFSLRILSLTATVGGNPVPLEVSDTCVLEPISIESTGTYDEAAGTISLSAEGFEIPEAAAGSCGMALGTIDIAEQINAALAGTANSFTAVIELGAEPETPATTTTVATTTTAAPAPTPAAPAATASAGRANNTG